MRNSVAGGIALSAVGTASAQSNDDPTPHEAPDRPLEDDDVVEKQQEHAVATLLKNCQPWEVPANEIAMQELGIPYDIASLDTEAADEDGLFPLDDPVELLVIPSTQNQRFYDILMDARADIWGFVANGGTLLAHMGSLGWPCNGEWRGEFLPGDVTAVQGEDYFTDQVAISDEDHPVVEGLTDSDLSWIDCSFGYFENTQDAPVDVVFGHPDGPQERPFCIVFEYGDGQVVATLQGTEWAFRDDNDHPERLLFNEFTTLVEGDAGGDEPDTGLVFDDLQLDTYVDGDAAQGGSVGMTTTAINNTEEPIERGIEIGFDDESIGNIDVALDAGASTGVSAEVEVGTVVEPGEVTVGFRATDAEPDVENVATLGRDTGLEASTASPSTQGSEPLPSTGSRQDHADVLLLKDSNPWDVPGNEIILQEVLDVSYERVNSTEFDQVMDNLEDYPVVLLPSVQRDTYDSRLESYAARIQEYISNGGILVAHMARQPGEMHPDVLPDGTTSTLEPIDNVSIVERDHPITGPFSDSDLSGWRASTHGYFSNRPDGSRLLVGAAGDPAGVPSYIEYAFGSGGVIATHHSIEWPLASDFGTAELLGRELLYALDVADGAIGTGETITDELNIVPLGDVDHNGDIGPGDVVKTLQFAQGGEGAVAGLFNPNAADLNQDGSIDQSDARRIQNRLVGNDVDIPEDETRLLDAGVQ